MTAEVGKVGARGSRGVRERLHQVVCLNTALFLSKQEGLMFIRLGSHSHSNPT